MKLNGQVRMCHARMARRNLVGIVVVVVLFVVVVVVIVVVEFSLAILVIAVGL